LIAIMLFNLTLNVDKEKLTLCLIFAAAFVAVLLLVLKEREK